MELAMHHSDRASYSEQGGGSTEHTDDGEEHLHGQHAHRGEYDQHVRCFILFSSIYVAFLLQHQRVRVCMYVYVNVCVPSIYTQSLPCPLPPNHAPALKPRTFHPNHAPHPNPNHNYTNPAPTQVRLVHAGLRAEQDHRALQDEARGAEADRGCVCVCFVCLCVFVWVCLCGRVLGGVCMVCGVVWEGGGSVNAYGHSSLTLSCCPCSHVTIHLPLPPHLPSSQPLSLTFPTPSL